MGPIPAEQPKANSLMNTQYLNYVFGKLCKTCNTLKAPETHHCSTCDSCISRMDHHCPWVNNCVGIYNQKYFLQFLLYVFLGSFHALVLIIWQCYGCMFVDSCYLFHRSIGMVWIAIGSVMLGLIFCLFVCIMFYDQMDCIITNMSTID